MSGPAKPRRSWLGLLAGVAVAGGAGWVVDTTLLWVLDTRFGVPSAVAAAIGFLAAGVVNFFVNRVVFRGRSGDRAQLLRYVILFLVNLAIVSTAVPLISHALTGLISQNGLRLIAAKIVTTGALLPVNAVAYHRWVFVVPPETPSGDTS